MSANGTEPDGVAFDRGDRVVVETLEGEYAGTVVESIAEPGVTDRGLLVVWRDLDDPAGVTLEPGDDPVVEPIVASADRVSPLQDGGETHG